MNTKLNANFSTLGPKTAQKMAENKLVGIWWCRNVTQCFCQKKVWGITLDLEVVNLAYAGLAGAIFPLSQELP